MSRGPASILALVRLALDEDRPSWERSKAAETAVRRLQMLQADIDSCDVDRARKRLRPRETPEA